MKKATIAAAAASLLLACKGDEITHYRVPKSAPQAAPTTMPASMEGAAPPTGAAAPAPEGGGGLRWTLPKGWSEARDGGGMRFATLKPPAAKGTVDVSVTVLPGPAGGELANVNRWRGQIGLGALDDAGLASARKPMKSAAGPVSLYDFTNDGAKKRVVAGLTVLGENTWFVKMTGDAAAVEAARPDFLRIVESLNRE